MSQRVSERVSEWQYNEWMSDWQWMIEWQCISEWQLMSEWMNERD